MAGWFEVDKAKDGQFKFVLKAGNAEIILTSELYKTKASAMNGIASVQKNSVMHAMTVKWQKMIKHISI